MYPLAVFALLLFSSLAKAVPVPHSDGPITQKMLACIDREIKENINSSAKTCYLTGKNEVAEFAFKHDISATYLNKQWKAAIAGNSQLADYNPANNDFEPAQWFVPTVENFVMYNIKNNIIGACADLPANKQEQCSATYKAMAEHSAKVAESMKKTPSNIDEYKKAIGDCSSESCVTWRIHELNESGLIKISDKANKKHYQDSINYCKINSTNEKSICQMPYGHYYIYFGKLIKSNDYR